MKYVCETCGLDCKTTQALVTHRVAKGHNGPKPKEVEKMEEREIRSLVKEELSIANQLKEASETVKKLQEELTAKGQELEGKALLEGRLKETEGKLIQMQKLQEEVNRLAQKDHTKIAEELLNCPECKSGLLKKVSQMICDDQGCRYEILKNIPDEELEQEISYRQENTKNEGKTGFTLGQAQ